MPTAAQDAAGHEGQTRWVPLSIRIRIRRLRDRFFLARTNTMQLGNEKPERARPPAVLRPDRHAFFLDLDGTLVEYARSSDSVTIDAGLLELLHRLTSCSGGALALLSGRSIASLDILLTPLQLPASGLHGFERRSATGVQTQRTLPGQQTLIETRLQMMQIAATDPHLLLEDKRVGFALHYRQAPHLEDFVLQAVAAIASLTCGALQMQRGSLVVELTPHGVNKGAALAEFMNEPPFQGRRPLCLGDDFTDEPAFEWVNAAGGLSVAVNVTRRPTAAMTHLRSVGEARAWLRHLADVSGATS